MASIAFIIVIAVILIKYTPQYKVSIDGKKIGYVEAQSDIDKYVDEKLAEEEGKNIAFVELKATPALKLELVDRNLENNDEILKNKITEQVSIQYTNYAISINGENQTYVSTMEDAEEIVEKLKKDYASKYTKNLGIVQVYSEDYNEIASVDIDKAKTTVSDKLKASKKADDIKIAKANAAKAAKLAASVPAKKITKESNVNGISFTVKPVSGTITSRFGSRSSPGGVGSTNHKGLDIAASCGSPIYAAASGTVEFSGTKGSLGKLVIINHGNGIKTYYGHCSSLKVSSGQKVEAGTNIAAVGKTGAATGYHLHFEVRVNGISVNPQKYIY